EFEHADGSRQMGYDYLLLASGATHAYFGNEHWAAHAPGLKTLDDALELRRRLLLAFERAESATDPEERDAWLSFAIIGAGPTGVELAGTLAEIARHTLEHEFRNIDPARARVRLVEAGPRVLSSFPEDLSHKARLQLQKLGVEVQTGAAVEDITAEGYRRDGRFGPARAGRQADGAARGALHPSAARRGGRRRPAVRLPRLRQPGHHRPHGRGGRPGRVALLRRAGLVVLAGRAPVLPDRIPQPLGGAAQL